MKNYLKDYGEKLNTFKLYLKTKEKLSDSTIEDYCKRIITICREEEFDIDYLNENIEKICYDYSDGDKKDLGARSHNSYRSALKQYKNYITQSNGNTANNIVNSQGNNPTYKIEAKKHCKHIAIIELKNNKGEVINAEMLKKDDLINFNKEFFKICYNLAIDEVLDKNGNIVDFIRFLKKMGFEITLSGAQLLNEDSYNIETKFDKKAWEEEMKKIQDEAPWK